MFNIFDTHIIEFFKSFKNGSLFGRFYELSRRLYFSNEKDYDFYPEDERSI